MSTPGRSAKKKKPISVKTSLNNPYPLQWSPLHGDHLQFIRRQLLQQVEETGLQKREVKENRRWFRKKKKQQQQQPSAKAPAVVPEKGAEETSGAPSEGGVEHGWTNVALRKELAIGINEVTRGLERNQLALVLVCKSVKPPHMTAHLLPLSASRAVPACQVPRLSETLAGPLGLRCVLALGIKRDAVVFSATAEVIAHWVPRFDMAGVPTDAIGNEVGSRKRKMEESPPVSPKEEASPKPCLHPLKVKKIIPNPAKVRKSKKLKK